MRPQVIPDVNRKNYDPTRKGEIHEGMEFGSMYFFLDWFHPNYDNLE